MLVVILPTLGHNLTTEIMFETKFEYIHPVWNMYLGGFDPETGVI